MVARVVQQLHSPLLHPPPRLWRPPPPPAPAACSFNFMWLSSFKALSWALDRGALCMRRFTAAQFLAVYATPITPVVSAEEAAAAHPAPTPAGPAGGTRSHEPSSAAAAAPADATAGGGVGSTGGKLPRRGSRGRLSEDAGSSGGMVAAWASKIVFIAILVRLLMHPLPGLLESLAYGGWVLSVGRRVGLCTAYRCPSQ